MSRRGICVVVALSLGMAIAPAGPVHAEQVGSYVGHSDTYQRGGEVTYVCSEPWRTQQSVSGVGIGGWCFTDVPSGTIKLEMSDLSGQPVGGAWFSVGGWGIFCGSEVVIDSFSGGEMGVFVFGPVEAATACTVDRGVEVGPGTRGDITVSTV